MKRTSENLMIGDLIADSAPTLLAIETSRAPWIRRVMEHLATQGGRAYFHWHPESGLTRNTGQRRSTNAHVSLPHFLLQIEDIILDAVYVVETSSLDDDSIEPLLHSLVERLTGTSSTLVLLSDKSLHLPASLSDVALVVTPDEQRSQIQASATPLHPELVGQRVMTVALAKQDRARLQESLQGQGTSATPSNQVYHSKADNKDAWKAVSGALTTHAQAVEDTSFLEYFSPEKCQLGLPGFQRLRQEVGLQESWLVDGTAGCGRSLTPFVAAEALGCGVIRLDGASLASQGTSTQIEATRKALGQLAQSMAPVVLWFDQMHDPSWERLHPSDWLSFANTTACLIIGTCGEGAAERVTTWSRSFTQRWWIDLPEPDQRRQLIAHHLNARQLACPSTMLETLAEQSAGLTADEIESDIIEVIKASLDKERAFRPESLRRFWSSRHDRHPNHALTPPGWRSAHGESQEVPLIPFTVIS